MTHGSPLWPLFPRCHLWTRACMPLHRSTAFQASSLGQQAPQEDVDPVSLFVAIERPRSSTIIDWLEARKNAVTASPSRHLPEPEKPVVRTPLPPLCFALVLIEIRASEWSGHLPSVSSGGGAAGHPALSRHRLMTYSQPSSLWCTARIISWDTPSGF
jgi:hypothetical protein